MNRSDKMVAPQPKIWASMAVLVTVVVSAILVYLLCPIYFVEEGPPSRFGGAKGTVEVTRNGNHLALLSFKFPALATRSRTHEHDTHTSTRTHTRAHTGGYPAYITAAVPFFVLMIAVEWIIILLSAYPSSGARYTSVLHFLSSLLTLLFSVTVTLLSSCPLAPDVGRSHTRLTCTPVRANDLYVSCVIHRCESVRAFDARLSHILHTRSLTNTLHTHASSLTHLLTHPNTARIYLCVGVRASARGLACSGCGCV